MVLDVAREDVRAEPSRVMSLDLTIGEKTKRMVLKRSAKGQFQVRTQVTGCDVMVAIYAEPHNFGILRIAAGEIETDDNFELELKKGIEITINVKAPAIPTFPGQPKVEGSQFPVRLKVVTTPHKSRAKPKPRQQRTEPPGLTQYAIRRMSRGR